MSLGAQIQKACERAIYLYADELDDANAIANHMAAAALSAIAEEPAHTITSIWQERSGEYSYRCSCGLVAKHQPFGDFTPHP
ncbi:hypothetical protein [Plantibacter sp. YIM 135249]|uniref:hypothetical protein n=1 Tax=Plantibacter sp. YIM 135249 TaxID=3423918 RepID=UPI003D3447EC